MTDTTTALESLVPRRAEVAPSLLAETGPSSPASTPTTPDSAEGCGLARMLSGPARRLLESQPYAQLAPGPCWARPRPLVLLSVPALNGTEAMATGISTPVRKSPGFAQ
jgi:hypothetical protein